MSVDLSKWIVQSYPTQFDASNWQVSADGSSVFQSVNGGASLFCSDFPANGSNLEGEITVLSATIPDDDFIGFAFGYSVGDSTNPDANWHLVDWKKGSQTLNSQFSYCNSAVTAPAGFAISEVKGTPVDAEFWAHTDFSCNAAGSLTEIQRGINYGNVGWAYNTAYNFRFEVSSNRLMAFVNDQLELDVAGSFETSGSFCYYNLSQDNVRYSGLTRQTANPTTSPTPRSVSTPTLTRPTGPSSDPSVPLADLPQIRKFNITGSTNKLGLCQGHCDTSDDCRPGLECFGRDAYHPVPGCLGGGQDGSRTNYCVEKCKPPIAETNNIPLGHCQGDCDSDTDCGPGLVCYQRDALDEVPGCFGGKYDVSETDYCVDEDDELRITQAPTAGPVGIPPVKSAGVFADPHFRSWEGAYSYQGACDLVFIETDDLTMHIRTTHGVGQQFSYVSATAVKLGGDLLEIRTDGSYFINGEAQLNPPTNIGGFPFSKGVGFSIDLGNGQSIRIRTFNMFMEVIVTGNESTFGDSKGVLGAYNVDKAVFRDGSQRTESPNQIAQEWIVDQQNGDPDLFLQSAPHAGCIAAVPLSFTTSAQAAAEAACARLSGLLFEECVFDCLASGSLDAALNPAFDDGLPDVPFCANENQCQIGTLLSDGTCQYTDIPCVDSSGTCDPLDGVCKTQSELAPCIAVIDESSQPNSYIESKWTEFRQRFPRRPFCLLRPIPAGASGGLYRPSAFDADPLTRFFDVTRDGQYNVNVSDWYELCGLEQWKNVIDFTGLFIDTSGSLTASYVQGAIDLFLEKLETNNLEYRQLNDPNEDWINLFIVDLV